MLTRYKSASVSRPFTPVRHDDTGDMAAWSPVDSALTPAGYSPVSDPASWSLEASPNVGGQLDTDHNLGARLKIPNTLLPMPASLLVSRSPPEFPNITPVKSGGEGVGWSSCQTMATQAVSTAQMATGFGILKQKSVPQLGLPATAVAPLVTPVEPVVSIGEFVAPAGNMTGVGAGGTVTSWPPALYPARAPVSAPPVVAQLGYAGCPLWAMPFLPAAGAAGATNGNTASPAKNGPLSGQRPCRPRLLPMVGATGDPAANKGDFTGCPKGDPHGER